MIDEGKSDFENIELNSFFNVKEARVEGRQIRVKYRGQERNKKKGRKEKKVKEGKQGRKENEKG